ncbi:flagellar FlbD family protein [Heliorestis convoluta]|uniref:Flagellar family protein n=1 Tax=Heliorestis convoluta TaxID=356322 RepID=A0A5Q2MZR9_9FIRM|nr:flagellar FlbD family protein [Heliorestis convoluta]QGG48177.1 flagellar family protein [Heliorestis convoluta]
MIKVTRLNQREMVVNADLIEFIESTPDTLLTLTTGKKVLITESVDEVIARVIFYKKAYHRGIDSNDPLEEKRRS